MLGLLIGDALGVPYEFKHPSQIPERIELLKYNERTIGRGGQEAGRRTWPAVPLGTWSDDGSLALALAHSLTACDGLNPDDLARRFAAWWEKGQYAVDGIVFDIGGTTRQALLNFRSGIPAELAGLDGKNSAGNGSLMRALPLALFHKGTDEELIRDAKIQSAVTHRHPLATNCCALYCLLARRLLNGTELYAEPFPISKMLAREFVDRDPTGMGYVVDSYLSAVDAFTKGTSYEDVVTRAIAFGHDTDTTAAIAGGLAGIKFGVPKKWSDGLRGYNEIARPIVERLALS
ncbi:MAG: ADP-ribosylglycohydrolase family protein [Vulcanimicrobiaceae bacterium]